MAEQFVYQGTTYQAGEGKTAQQVAADYNPELKTAVAVAPVTTPVTTTTAPTTIPGTSPTTVTSDPLRADLAKTEADIRKASEASAKLTEQYRTALEQRRADEVARIKTDFAGAEQAQQQAQRSETGTKSMGLARIGGFDSASGQAVLTNLQRVHDDEQQALIAKRENAIRTAENAYADKDFELARLQLEEARKTEETIYERQKDFLNLSLQYKQDARAEETQKFNVEQAKKQDQKDARDFSLKWDISDPFYVVGGIAYDSSTGEALDYDMFIERGGQPDFSNAFLVDPGSQQAKDWVSNMMNKYVDIPITPDMTPEQVSALLPQSKIYRRETYIAPSGGGGGDTDTKGAFISNALTAFSDVGEDGFINPDVYREVRNEWARKFGSIASFYKEFPIDVYISEDEQTGDLIPPIE